MDLAWERDCVIYLRQLTACCRDCLRRFECDRCSIPVAKRLLERHSCAPAPTRAELFRLNQRQILDALARSRTPLRSREISLPASVGRARKNWALQTLVRSGLVGRIRLTNPSGKFEVAYFLKPTTTPKKETSNGNIPNRGA